MLDKVGSYNVGDTKVSLYDALGSHSVINVETTDKKGSYSIVSSSAIFTPTPTAIESYRTALSAAGVASSLTTKIGESNKGEVFSAIGAHQDGYYLKVGRTAKGSLVSTFGDSSLVNEAYRRLKLFETAYNDAASKITFPTGASVPLGRIIGSYVNHTTDGNNGYAVIKEFVALLNEYSIPAVAADLTSEVERNKFWEDNVVTWTYGSNNSTTKYYAWGIPRSYFFGHVLSILSVGSGAYWDSCYVSYPLYELISAANVTDADPNKFCWLGFRAYDSVNPDQNQNPMLVAATSSPFFLATIGKEYSEYLLSFEDSVLLTRRAEIIARAKELGLAIYSPFGSLIPESYLRLYGELVLSNFRYPVFVSNGLSLLKFSSTETDVTKILVSPMNIVLSNVERIDVSVDLTKLITALGGDSSNPVPPAITSYCSAHPSAHVCGIISQSPLVPLGHRVLEETILFATARDNDLNLYEEVIDGQSIKTMSNKANAIAGTKRILAYVHPFKAFPLYDQNVFDSVWSVSRTELIENKAGVIVRYSLLETSGLELFKQVVRARSVSLALATPVITESEIATTYLGCASFAEFRRGESGVEFMNANKDLTLDLNVIAPQGFPQDLVPFSSDPGKRCLFIAANATNQDLENIVASQLLWIY